MKTLAWLAALALTATACGSSGSPAAAGATTPTPTPTPTVPATFGPYTFTFGAGTSGSDQQLISDSVQSAHAYFTSVFGRTITQASTVTSSTSAAGCAAGGAAAFTGPAAVTFCIGNPGWTNLGSTLRQKVVMHELFHVWQYEYRWLGNAATTGPDWIIEGSAELVGYRAAVNRGLFASNIIIGCQVKEAADFAARQPPGLPNLDALESHQAFQTTVGPSYTISMIGMDELVNGPGLSALRVYGDALAGGSPWPTAFQSAFGTTPAAFYAQFPSYKASLPVPATYQCGS